MQPLEGVSRGDQPSADHMNQLVDRINDLSSQLERLSPQVPETTYLDLYEITVDPVLDDDTREYYAKGQPVYTRWCQVDGSGNWVADSYQGVAGVKERLRLYDTDDAVKLWFPTQTRDPNDNQEADGVPDVTTGDRVFVTILANFYAVVSWSGEGGLRRFSMTAALTLGGSATTNLQVWDSVGEEYADDDEETEFTVYDFHNKFSKPATTAGADGALGVARFWADRGVWEIVSMSTPMYFKARVDEAGDVASSDGSFDVDNFTPLFGCYSHVVDSAEEVVVQNTFSDDIDNNAWVTVTWNATDEQFEIADATCPA